MSQSITEGKCLISMVVYSNEILLGKVYGEFRTGKTQMAHTMCVVTQLPPELGGASGKVFCLCPDNSPSAVNLTRSHTSTPKVCGDRPPYDVKLTAFQGTFRPDRIRSIADRFGVDGTMALENILYGVPGHCPLDYCS